MAKAKSKTKPDECPKCGTRDSTATYCPNCGARIGHTGKRGRPFSKEKSCHIYAWVPQTLRAEVTEWLNEDESESAFLRAAIERELKVRKRRHGQ